MKKIIFLMLLSVFLFSCSSDNDSAPDLIIGKWQVIKYSDPVGYERCDYSSWFHIMEGGKLEDYDDCSKKKQTGTWTQKDKVLTFKSSDFPIPFSAKIVLLTKTTLELEFEDFGYKETITYKRL